MQTYFKHAKFAIRSIYLSFFHLLIARLIYDLEFRQDPLFLSWIQKFDFMVRLAIWAPMAIGVAILIVEFIVMVRKTDFWAHKADFWPV